jgi:hypothetical protein
MLPQVDSRNSGDSSSTASSLIASASCGITSACSFIDEKDALLQLLMAKFSSELTRYQRNNFYKILSLINNKYDPNKE